MMDVQSLFGDVPVATFVAEYLHRLPFALAGSACEACELGTWDAAGEVLAGAGEDAFAVREGRWYEGDMPRDVAAARALVEERYTLFVRHAERHHARLAELARAFERTFQGPVNIHVFVTPAGAPGFSWHYDAEDVFILQTAGEKEYSLRKNTVNPWPLEETLPADMQYERELMPLMRVLLRAGDLLYIPCGYWHKAEARRSSTGLSPSAMNDGLNSVLRNMDETTISLAIGVMSPSAMDVYEFLRSRLVQSLVWRQRLPITGPASPLSRDELEATHRQIFQQLAADLQRTLADPQLLAEFLDWLAARPADEPPTDREKQ
jgi:50S ribosomal protein L16 3-hydroxylase